MRQYAVLGGVPRNRIELPFISPERRIEMTHNETPHICLVQPPFTQLNSPYPGIYYLRSFLEGQGCAVTVRDHSIMLFEKIFCRTGLEKIFNDINPREVKDNPIVESFFSERDRWLASIDRTVDFLRGKDHEWGYLIALANGVLPRGVSSLYTLMEIQQTKGDPTIEDAPLLASKLLADIADLITVTLDRGFSLIRYVPSPGADLSPGLAAQAGGYRDFSIVSEALNGYVMRTFYRPLLETEWKNLAARTGWNAGSSKNMPLVLGTGIPFPGCLAGALVCAESAKKFFGSDITTVAGGGYVNTELRFITETKFFDYFDYLTFDRGYGAWDSVLRKLEMRNEKGEMIKRSALYKTVFRDDTGIIVKDDFIVNVNSITDDTAIGMHIDDEAAQTVFPDYSDVDFSRYICPVDDVNPMHRLWSDGRWLKVYAAHGCYWHNCAFCDTSLDYIRCYKPVDSEALFHHLQTQAEKTGVRGVHLADEACPPASLLHLALLNRKAGLPLLFWGNIRFEKSFTPDAAAILASGGVIGVSAGIEVAAAITGEKGFDRIGKGINLADVVASCAAVKEAGILVHAYLIYGYWDEGDGEIIDSAEIMRQLFEAELLDSAFWHQFSLTKHSRIYAEKLRGLHPALQVTGDSLCDTTGGVSSQQHEKIFALNDLSFVGEERFNRFGAPLESLLQAWMRRPHRPENTAEPVRNAFPFKVPSPSIAPDLVSGLLDAYARSRDKTRQAAPPVTVTQSANVVFLGSNALARTTGKNNRLHWCWRFQDCELTLPKGQEKCAAPLSVLLDEASEGMSAPEFFSRLKAIFGENTLRIWKALRKQGLALFWGRLLQF
jgi:radical SAM superfamily enzyme YgiQ (UPF0313 family)